MYKCAALAWKCSLWVGRLVLVSSGGLQDRKEGAGDGPTDRTLLAARTLLRSAMMKEPTSCIQTVEMKFLHRVAKLIVKDRYQTFVFWDELRAAGGQLLLHRDGWCCSVNLIRSQRTLLLVHHKDDCIPNNYFWDHILIGKNVETRGRDVVWVEVFTSGKNDCWDVWFQTLMLKRFLQVTALINLLFRSPN